MKNHSQINAAALISILLGFVVIIGWIADIQILKSVIPGFVTMKFNTALCFVLLGTCIYLLPTNKYKVVYYLLASLIIIVGVLSLTEDIFQFNLGLDNFSSSDNGAHPGRMAPTTAFCFILFGLVFVFFKNQSLKNIAQFTLHIISLVSFLPIVGYILQVPPLYRLTFLTSMAIHTAIALFILSITASFINPNLGITGLFTGKRIGNKMARNLFPKLLLALLLLTMLRIEAHRMKIIDVEFGIVLFALSFILVGLLLVWNSGSILNKIDYERESAENELKFTNQHLESIVEERTAELHLAVNKIKETSDRNKIFIEQSPNAIAMFDNEMRYIAASEKWINDYGLQGRDIIGHSHYEVFPEIGDDWKKIHQECLKGAINKCDEAPFERSDGSMQWLTWDVRPWYITKDEIGGLLMYTSDITSIKEKDREKLRVEGILDKTNEIARVGTWEVDLIANKIIWSRITREIHEVEPDYQPRLETAINFFKEGESREKITSAVEAAIKDGKSYDLELELITAKGKNLWTRAIGQAEFKNGLCQRLFGIFQDIDDVKKSREAAFILNEELKTILNAGHVSIIGTDVNGIITHFNSGAEQLLQYKASELIGIHTPAIIHVEDEVIQRGTELTAIYGRKIEGFDAFVEVARSSEHETREWTYVRKDGSRFPVQLVVTAIKDQQGDIKGFLGVATDITDIENAKIELQVLTDKLQKQNKQLLNFAHITSHNLRSPVSNLNTILYLHKEADEEEKKVLCGHMETVVNHLTQTLDQLVDSLKIQQDKGKEREWLKLEDVFIKIKEMFVGAIIESRAVITADFSEAEYVEFPRTYLESVFLNMLSNALKYKSDKRQPTINFKSEKTSNGIRLIVSDNGLGIDLKKHGDKLFGLNKTFHRHPEAKGVGLFMTKIQIEAMGGSIETVSEVDEGTTFIIYFKKNI